MLKIEILICYFNEKDNVFKSRQLWNEIYLLFSDISLFKSGATTIIL